MKEPSILNILGTAGIAACVAYAIAFALVYALLLINTDDDLPQGLPKGRQAYVLYLAPAIPAFFSFLAAL